MRVCVFEPDHTGHHLTYARLLLAALLDVPGTTVVLVTGAVAGSTPEYAAQVAPVVARRAVQGRLTVETVVPTPLPRRPLANARARTAALLHAVRRTGADHVLVPYADGLAQVWGAARAVGAGALPRGVEAEGLIMRGGFAYPRPGTDIGGLVRAALGRHLIARAPLVQVHFLDPIPFDAVRRAGGSLAARARLMPDPVEPPPPLDRQTARAQLGIPPDGRYIGCAGGIDERKGADRLLRAFADASLGATDRLLLVGRASPGVRRLLETDLAVLVHAGRVISLDRYVSDEELTAGMAAMDLVCTPYPGHVGSASIVIRAAAAGRMVLASDFGWMQYVVPRFGLGRTCDATDAAALAAALPAALDAAAAFRSGAAAAAFAAFHSPANFATAWTARLRERLGLPPAPASRTWEDVEAAASHPPDDRALTT